MTAAQVVTLLKEKQITVATAESCTAGLLSAAITAVSGASSVFECGISAYSAEIKHGILGVPTDILEQYGTVSNETAAAMADGVRRIAGSTIGVSITGVAGPNETEGKPVGRVHIALANETRVWLQTLTPDPTLSRDAIREKAVTTALEMVATFADAYPTLCAGSLPLTPATVQEVVIPSAPVQPRRRFLALLLPWKGDTVKQWVIKTLCWLVIVGLLVAGGFGVYRLATLSENKSLYSGLQNMYVDLETENQSNKDVLSRFDSLYMQNADIGGWLCIDGTAINYPVMKNAGSDYYATHNFRQEYSVYGAPFFDERNNLMSAAAQNKVLIIYGNNTGDGQMFSELADYRKMEFFKQHTTVEMSTLFSADKWLVFGVMV
ncbi:MAG: nicotinamide-nucleotide amidohydrolase family protein, partial [Clostridia bacterium]|nr:nicotinamide-nucleotide amidohydrolase family protein [Clostridia bacterium]